MFSSGSDGGETTGEKAELAFRLTIGLRKVDNGWIIFHEHHSVPATD
jgi:ketosteroid isomerase-like protein